MTRSMVRLFAPLFVVLLIPSVRGENAAPTAPALARFTHPGAGQTFYLFMPDRFANGKTENDTGGMSGGPEVHGFDPTRISHYHGGDFIGATQKLDYIKGLNTTAVWTMPPFKNRAVQPPTAGYHGYWPTDFLSVDPHLGTNDEYKEFIRQTHARGMRVYLDIITNHTADVITFQGGTVEYVSKRTAPYRDANGNVFDERALAYNGLNNPAAFPALSAERSFPYRPVLPADAPRKHPEWLNDVTLYHNRGNSSFQGESSVLGDFMGLDGVMTEHPTVVNGFIDIFRQWLEWGVDGFRIDTMRHVNSAFWQAFNPALRARAVELGRPHFLQFGEVMNEHGDVAYLSEFSTGTMAADSTLDFPFATTTRRYLSQGAPAAVMHDLFARDDYYLDHDSNVHSTVTLLGNYDVGRWAYFLEQDNPGATAEQTAELVRIGHALMYLSRGMPVLHWGDEQGMIGRGGNDMGARESMFPAQAPQFRDAPLLGTTRTGKDDKFDPDHPFYRFFSRLGKLRADHAALRTGAMIVRPTSEPGVLAFSRVERSERVEYVAVFNNARSATVTCTVPTSQSAGARMRRLLASHPAFEGDVDANAIDATGALRVTLPPLSVQVWRAETVLPPPSAAPGIKLVTPGPRAALAFSTREIDGELFPSRREIRAEVTGGDDIAEVTFLMTRASRAGQYEVLGIDDAPPYRVFWSPPADLAPNEKIAFHATVSDLRGQVATAVAADITVAPGKLSYGIPGAHSPQIVNQLPAEMSLTTSPAKLEVRVEGTGPLEFQWYRNGELIAGATSGSFTPREPGEYRVAIHNLAGTTVSSAVSVR